MLLRANSFLLSKSNPLVLRATFHPSGLRRTNKIRFCSSSDNHSIDMDKKEKFPEDSGDAMSSFGEGYATRSDEEGFGGIYPDRQQLNKDRTETNEDHPEGYDKSQGSEVKDEEKGRNQRKEGACK